MKNIKQKPKLHQDWIDRHALDIVKKLKKKKFTVYLVGGCVRDLLVNLHPKDFDIATNATPHEVKRCIPHSYIIGKRFRLVLARRGDLQFEIATFRRNITNEELEEQEEAQTAHLEENPDGRKLLFGDNTFGTPQQDTTRRDFTINSLFYDPITDKIIDYNNGMEDIEARQIKMIGDPITRLKEDPIRILRALRLGHKLDFIIDTPLKNGIEETAHTLEKSVLPRRREEILKFLRLKRLELLFQRTYDLGALKYTSPTLNEIYKNPDVCKTFSLYLERIPNCIHNPDSPIELFALLVMSYISSTHSFDFDNPEYIAGVIDLLRSDKIQQFLRTELGLFKYEQSIVLKSISQAYQLRDLEEFQRKGIRRQQSFLKQSSFSLALMLAEFDFLLSPTQITFWHHALKNS